MGGFLNHYLATMSTHPSDEVVGDVQRQLYIYTLIRAWTNLALFDVQNLAEEEWLPARHEAQDYRFGSGWACVRECDAPQRTEQLVWVIPAPNRVDEGRRPAQNVAHSARENNPSVSMASTRLSRSVQ
jgi:hypothetical protein